MANVDSEINRLVESAQLILDRIVDNFDSNSIEIPAHRYIAVGELGSTAHDKEQITVGFSNMSDGLPSNSVAAGNICKVADHASFYVELVRCTPQPVVLHGGAKSIAPPVDKLQEYATLRMKDAWLLKRVADDMSATIWNKKAVYGITVPPESGGMQAVVLSLNMVV